jgi:CO/xanthine dehydrogenase Mo-binding subunit
VVADRPVRSAAGASGQHADAHGIVGDFGPGRQARQGAGGEATGNSNAIRAAWQPMRQAGATARTMLVSAAAKRWNVAPASCRAQRGGVLHAPTGRNVEYGELAAEAARMPIPSGVVLKRPADFRLVGTPAKRLDTPAKVNGTAVYGIDARPPGVKIATLAQSPVFGGRVKNLDDKAAKAVKGVRQIAVALIAFLLLRLAQTAQKVVVSPLAFARLVRTNLMHRMRIDRLLDRDPRPTQNANQFTLDWAKS